MPQGINRRHDVGITTPPATTPQGGPPPAGGSRPAPAAKPEGLAARSSSTSAGMPPRQRGPQAPTGQARGVPAYPQPSMASHFAVPPMVPAPRSQVDGAFGGGGIMQRVRNAFQQVRQFPQQLHELAHQASHYPSSMLQHALSTARMAGQDLLSAALPMMPLPRPPLHLAHEFSAGVQSFDAASLGRQLVQLEQQVLQRAQDHLALLRQSFHVPAADSQRLGAGAPAGAFPGAVPAKVHQD